jgi:hypothetical protein
MDFTIFTWIDRLASVGKKTSEIRLGEPVVQPLFGREQWEKNLAAIGRPLSRKAQKDPTDGDLIPTTRKTGERKQGFAFIQWQENHPQLPMFHKS